MSGLYPGVVRVLENLLLKTFLLAKLIMEYYRIKNDEILGEQQRREPDPQNKGHSVNDFHYSFFM